MRMTVGEILEACGGELLCGDVETVVTSVSTDSRQIEPGALFVPIKGERTDAHAYIDATFAAGAVASLTEEHAQMEDTHAWIRVPSTQTALQLIATAYRARFAIPVVGVTGSVGKTTTKEMIALALSAGKNVMKTEGNFNSQIGLPLTLFRLEPQNEAAVVEMGMSDFGEMSRLAQIAAPNIAVVTNIGISHIQQLKTQQNIMEEKLHIIDRFTPESILFLNGDDPLLAGLRGRMQVRMRYFGMQPWCDYRAEQIEFHPNGVRFLFCADETRQRVELPVLGLHNVTNALASLAVSQVLGVDLQAAAESLGGYHPLAMRQQLHRQNGVTVIDDSYNASPDAIKSSLDVLQTLREQDGRCIAVLADMLELGALEDRAHYEVGAYAARTGIDALVTVGKRAKRMADGAKKENPELLCLVCDTNDEAVSALKKYLQRGDVVLVKGSRGMHTDEIVKCVLACL
ncbi:UDP-N-acetylmuramoyl-tripeptide--D-alanyl-D-alanine ligase [Clostridium sp. D33t1_170424_F3]|uniref:UDP-N-acetylmuramoyl-tripeptide--D-alanyl-D- alanine ligase n=1 Tax=Clostridium sp. D33t1_170424_F3 TaxID=2787099 RepID=UPI0018AABCF9|nr:UDP-N-acetylmuramoyl-tripeptide--D-alanyl-D-alanine ligase [Clostridium sp. D33t1_170424_F3]